MAGAIVLRAPTVRPPDSARPPIPGYFCQVRFLCRFDFKRLRRLCFDILRRRFFFRLPMVGMKQA